MISLSIVLSIILISTGIYFILLRKKECKTLECKDSRVEDISRAKMNLDPKWNKGCVRDSKTGHFKRK